jgi:hypothetical protein
VTLFSELVPYHTPKHVLEFRPLRALFSQQLRLHNSQNLLFPSKFSGDWDLFEEADI